MADKLRLSYDHPRSAGDAAPTGEMVDMRVDYAAVEGIPTPVRPDYPYGLRICLTERELAKLAMDCDCDIGDVVEFRCGGVVTSVNKSDENGMFMCRIEIQITNLAVDAEGEIPDEAEA